MHKLVDFRDLLTLEAIMSFLLLLLNDITALNYSKI